MNESADTAGTACIECGEPLRLALPSEDGIKGDIQVTVQPVRVPGRRHAVWEAGIWMDTPEWSLDGDIAIGLGGIIGATPIDALSRMLAIIAQESAYSFSSDTTARATDAICTTIRIWSRSQLIDDDIDDYYFLVVAADGRVIRSDRRTGTRSQTGMHATTKGLISPWTRADELEEFFRIVSSPDGPGLDPDPAA